MMMMMMMMMIIISKGLNGFLMIQKQTLKV